jgi:hypothetical protein
MHPTPSPAQRFVGAFLFGTAALALFDAWFPGLFIVLGGCLLGYSVWEPSDTTQAARVGAVLLLSSFTYLLWRWLGRIAPDYVFIVVILSVAIFMLIRFDLPDRQN